MQTLNQKFIAISRRFDIPFVIVVAIAKKLIEFEERDATRH